MVKRSNPVDNDLDLDTLHETIASLFHGAQASNASHKRRVKALCKLHADASSIIETRRSKKEGDADEFLVFIGEKMFNRAFWAVLLCILNLKRGVSQADRVVRFVGLFVGSLLSPRGDKKEEDEEESAAERFFQRLVVRVLPGCAAKDKTVRYRCTQLLSEILRNAPCLDEDLYEQAREVLLERANDREYPIRAAACLGLGVLVQGEGSDSNDGSRQSLSSILEEICHYDVHPNVRVASLPGVAMVLNTATLPILLTRSRDNDKTVRKTVFRLLRKVPVRSLSVTQRSMIVRNGMGDREASVRSEASKLLAQWALSCSATKESGPSQSGYTGPSKVDLDEFIDLFDLWDGEVAEEAVKALAHHYPDIFHDFDLSQQFWFSLSPSKAILARIFTQLVNSSAHDAQTRWNEKRGQAQMPTLDDSSTAHVSLNLSRYIDSLPVLSLQAITVQSAFNLMVSCAQALNSNGEMPEMPGIDRDDVEEKLDDCIFSLGEMLKMTTSLLGSSNADEMGRRKVNKLVIDMLQHPYFPSTLLAPALELLKAASTGSVEFIRTTIRPILDDVIREQRQKDADVSRRYTLDVRAYTGDDSTSSSDDETSVVEISEEDRIRTAFLRLCIINEALRSIDWPSSEDDILRLLQRLLVKPSLAIYAEKPSVPDSVKSKVFDEALTCLGLVAVASETLALNALGFCIRGAMGAIPPQHTPRVLDCLFDILVTHPRMVTSTFADVIKEIPEELASTPFLPMILVNSLQSEQEIIQAKAVVGVCKLHLTNIWSSEELLEALIILYFLPDTVDNQPLRQCLAYFFPAFCFSSHHNQSNFSKVVVGSFIKLCSVLEEIGQEEMQPPDLHRVISMLLDLCDPSNLTNIAKVDDGDRSTIVNLASSLIAKVKILLSDEGSEDPALCGVGPICQALGQLRLSDVEYTEIQELLSSTSGILTDHTPKDKGVFKLLTSFETKLRKVLSRQDISEEDGRRSRQARVVEKRKRGGSSDEGSAEDSKRHKRRDIAVKREATAKDGSASDEAQSQSIILGFQGKPRARLRSVLDSSDSGPTPSTNSAAVSRKKRKP